MSIARQLGFEPGPVPRASTVTTLVVDPRNAEIASLKAQLADANRRLIELANSHPAHISRPLPDANKPNAPANTANTANKADEARKAYQRELMRKRRAAAKAKG